MNKKISAKDRNIARIVKVVEAERLIEQAEYNKDKKWWNSKTFDYGVFVSGFNAGMGYAKRIREGHNLEDEEEE